MKKGEVLFHEGEPGRHLYIVRSGSVKVYKLSADGKERILQVFGPGQFFAELPVLDGRNYPASAEALSPGALLFVSRENIVQLLSRYPQMTAKVYEIVGDRLRHFATAVTDLTLKDASRRLAGFLLAKMEAYDPLGQDVVRFPLELTHQEIASLIGTARETVSRTLRQFEKDGIIEMKERHITVRDKSLLAQAAG
ncbi:MAG: Crp/Fnr family transcriptional regulator [bacterium]|nr:Crp/Fnr family transcriptional regulator [bacterium]